MNKNMKICVLASGGDAPGMNACIEAIFNYATQCNINVSIALGGYDGLVFDKIITATRERCNNISHLSGCAFKCARSPEFMTQNGLNKALATIKKHGFSALVVLGGNGSLLGLERLKLAGTACIGIPATIDNDVLFTKNSLGFASACEAIVQEIDMIKTTMRSHDRNFLVQVMGRHCSELAIKTGIATFADIVDIAENRNTPKQIAETFLHQRAKGNMSCMAVVQEHRPDMKELHRSVQIAAQDNGLREDVLGYSQRGTSPSCHDRYLAAHYAVIAVDCVRAQKFGIVIGNNNDEFITVPIEVANKAKYKFNRHDYDLVHKISYWV